MTKSVQFNAKTLELWEAFRKCVSSALNDETTCSTFELFSAFMQDPATLRATMNFLKASRCDLLLKPSPRTLLAALMVVKFPVEILNIDPIAMRADNESGNDENNESSSQSLNQQSVLDRECVDAAQSVVNIILSENGALDKLLIAQQVFQEVFGRWKQHDKDRLLRELSDTFYQWKQSLEHLEENTKDATHPESIDVMKESVKEQIEATKRRILQIGGPDALEQIIATPPVKINLDELVAEAGAKQYWDEFSAELRSKKYDRVVTLLSEIRNRLKALLPNRPDRQATIETDIDVDFIRQMIHYGSFDGEAFLKVFVAIWKHIKDMQAASADAAWKEWRKQVLKRADTDETTWDTLIPSIFNRFLVQLDAIEEATNRVRAQLNNNVDSSSEITAESSS